MKETKKTSSRQFPHLKGCLFLLVLLLTLLSGGKTQAALAIKQISLGSYHCAAINADGSLWTWGGNNHGQLGDGTTSDAPTPIKMMDNVTQVVLEDNHSAAIKTDGSLWTWGSNYCYLGPLNNDSKADYHAPIKMMDNVAQVAPGNNYSMAIKTDGSLWAWGSNSFGQLGNGTKSNSPTPVKVMDNVAQVVTLEYRSAAIKTDGSLWTWGFNMFGQLGNGTTSDSSTPVKVMDDVAQVILGSYYSAAIKTDGSLWTWGDNDWVQLGNGTRSDSYTPVKVMDNVAQVALGHQHCAAIKTDGSLWTWGSNYYGQLGNGTTSSSSKPIKIMDNVAQVEVALEEGYSAAIKTDGSLWTWGSNSYGQLGNGTTSYSVTPVKVMDNVAQVALGNNYSAAIKTDGSLWNWGNGLSARLGNVLVPTSVVFYEPIMGKFTAKDMWGFENPYAKIKKSYYQRFFGKAVAKMLYEANEKSAHGLCYGMVVSAMAILFQQSPPVSSFGVNSLFDIKKENQQSSAIGKAIDYIKYAFILQYTPLIHKELYANAARLDAFYRAVKEYALGNGQPVNIDIQTQNGAHSLWALGIRSESDQKVEISVYDCEHPGRIRVLTLYKSGDSFTSWKYPISNSDNWSGPDISSYQDGDSVLYYSTKDTQYFVALCAINLLYETGDYELLLTVDMSDSHFESEKDEQEFYQNLIKGNAGAASGSLVPVLCAMGENVGDTGIRQFWYTGGDSLTLKGVPAGAEISVTAPSHSVSATTDAKTDLAFNVDNTGKSTVTANIAGKYEVSYYDAAKDGKVTVTEIETNGKQPLIAKKTGTDVYMTGAETLTAETAIGMENDEGELINPQKSKFSADNLNDGKTYNISQDGTDLTLRGSSKNNDKYDEVISSSKALALNGTFKSGALRYKVTKLDASTGTVSVTGTVSKPGKSIVVPDTVSINGIVLKVTAIGKNAFQKASKLTNITIGRNVTSIGANAFAGSKKLKKITFLGTGLKTVGKKAVKGIAARAVIYAPKSRTAKYRKLFTSATGFTAKMKVTAASAKTWKVTFKDGKKTVKTQTVKDGKAASAPKLKKKGYILTWSASFAKVKKNLTVKAIWTPELPKKGYIAVVSGYKYKVTKSAKSNGTVQLSGVVGKKQKTYSVPENVKIGKYRFRVTSIGAQAFADCKAANKIALPKTITAIAKNAFANVSADLTVTVPKAAYSRISELLKKSGLSGNVKIKER